MRIEFYSVSKLKKEIIGIINKYLNPSEYNAFFFGSRVSGGGSQRSDIDIGIEGPREIPYEIMAKIKDDIDGLAVLYKIEIVDFKNVSPDFYEVASTNREYL